MYDDILQYAVTHLTGGKVKFVLAIPGRSVMNTINCPRAATTIAILAKPLRIGGVGYRATQKENVETLMFGTFIYTLVALVAAALQFPHLNRTSP